MAPRKPFPAEGEAHPVLLFCCTVFFIGCLLLLSGVLDGDDSESGFLPSGEGGGGGGGAGTFVPGSPVSGYDGGSPLNDGGPAVTIIQDVRETMNRLPTNRNDPELYDPPPRRKPKSG